MDELKLLIEMVANLPTLAVWVLVGYLVYKIAVIGSIYGLVRFGIDKLHSWLMQKAKPEREISLLLHGLPFDDSTASSALLEQLERLKFIGKPGQYSAHQIYANYGVKLLRETIDRMYAENKEP